MVRLCAGPKHVDSERPKHGYLTPPQEFLDIVDRPPEPSLSFSPDRRKILQMLRPPPMPPISELARPEVKLAGASLAHLPRALGARPCCCCCCIPSSLQRVCWTYQASALVLPQSAMSYPASLQSGKA